MDHTIYIFNLFYFLFHRVITARAQAVTKMKKSLHIETNRSPMEHNIRPKRQYHAQRRRNDRNLESQDNLPFGQWSTQNTEHSRLFKNIFLLKIVKRF